MTHLIPVPSFVPSATSSDDEAVFARLGLTSPRERVTSDDVEVAERAYDVALAMVRGALVMRGGKPASVMRFLRRLGADVSFSYAEGVGLDCYASTGCYSSNGGIILVNASGDFATRAFRRTVLVGACLWAVARVFDEMGRPHAILRFAAMSESIDALLEREVGLPAMPNADERRALSRKREHGHYIAALVAEEQASRAAAVAA